MTSFVLVPGGWFGGWWYQPLVDALEARGHRATAVTPSGLDPSTDRDRPDGTITLDTHIADTNAAVEKALDDAGDEQIVLVGHSYGGFLISAAADRFSSRVRALVYLDAFTPEDGDTLWGLTNDEERQWFVDGAKRTGVAVDPLSFLDEKSRPHPLASFMQAVQLTGAWRDVPVKHYVEATGWEGGSPLASNTAKVRSEAGWTVHAWDTTHNVLREGPERVLQLIEGL